MNNRSRATDQRLLLLCVAPFAGSVLLSLILVLLTLAWPVPTLAPGAAWRLALPGALAALASWAGVVWTIWRRTDHPATRKAGAALTAVTALLATPVLTLGVMQWLNGSWVTQVQRTPLALQRLSTSRQSHSSDPYHWAHLQGDASAGLPPGKYLLSADVYEALRERQPGMLTVHHARGLLGARVVLGFSE